MGKKKTSIINRPKSFKAKGREVAQKVELEDIVKLKVGDVVEGTFKGFTNILGRKVPLIEVSGKLFGLNSHTVLINKLLTISEGVYIEIYCSEELQNERKQKYFDYQIFIID